jgi:hypothetical protein
MIIKRWSIAFQLAVQSFLSARQLLHENTWEANYGRTFLLLSRLAAWVSDSFALYISLRTHTNATASPLGKVFVVSFIRPFRVEICLRLGECEESDSIIADCFRHTECPEDKAKVLRLRSRNHWMRNRFKEALSDTLTALHLLGVQVNESPTKREADLLFDHVKNEILAVGFEEIVSMPRTKDPRIDLAVELLNEAGKWCFYL